MKEFRNYMNRVIVIISLALCITGYSFAQAPIITKGATVVPKFALKWSDFDSSWRGFLKAELVIEQSSAGTLAINGNERWEEIPFFPASDRSKEGLRTQLYKMEYSRPSIAGYKIDSIDRKKDFTEIKLSKLKDRIVDLKIRFGNSIHDVQSAIQSLFFFGNLEEFGKSDYFIDKVMPKILKGTKSENLPKEEKQRLMNGIGNDVNSLKVFKQQLYLGSEFKDTTVFNSNLVNEAERATRTIQKYFSEMKKKAEMATAFNAFDGVKIETTLTYRNFSARPFLDDSSSDFDSFEFYVPIDALKLFIEAGITDQELVDKSFVLLNGNRIRVNLSQFSN